MFLLPLSENSENTLVAFCKHHGLDSQYAIENDIYERDYTTMIECYFEQGKHISFEYLINDLDCEYIDRETYELVFTLYGDYTGSTVQRSNHAVVGGANLNCLVNQQYDYFTEVWQLSGEDIKPEEWQQICEWVCGYESYSVLDEYHYSDQTQSDLCDSWEAWQSSDVERDLIKLFSSIDIDLDDLNIGIDMEVVCEWISEYCETTEVNSQSSYYISDHQMNALFDHIRDCLDL